MPYFTELKSAAHWRAPTQQQVLGRVALSWLTAAILVSPLPAKADKSNAVSELAEGAATVVDLSGRSVNPFGKDAGKAVVLIFVSNDCPISNRYAPELQRLNAAFSTNGITFWIVHPDPDETVEAIRTHAQEYRYPIRILRDPAHVLVRRAQAKVTPEAAVFRPDGELLYHGRIDDRYVAFGKERSTPTRHDLEEVLRAIVAGKPIHLFSTRAIGCYIAPPR